jgi:outer membrane lipoprotein carrier protein
MTPEVRQAVEKMQKFYEKTRDFDANFKQTYKYKTFARKTQASGRVRFMKSGASMRWDYWKPNEKIFVIAGEKIYAYDQEAQQLTISRLNSDRLSASITFLWGQGKLTQEFVIQKSTRQGDQNRFALELTPKIIDPRFQKIYFVLDPTSYSVRESMVIDPDGSENHMLFSEVKTDTGLSKADFRINPPQGTNIVRMDETGKKK